MQKALKLYLAGPDVFLNVDTGAQKKVLCLNAGYTPLYPLDNEIMGDNAAKEILGANLNMISEADLVIANISPFRGPHCDPGTAFEVGYALQSGKRILLYSNDSRSLIARIKEDFPSIYADNTSIEDFELTENLMLSKTAETFCVDDRSDQGAMKAFIKALESI